MYTDASPVGLGAVLAQSDDSGEDGNLRPVCFLSRSLTAPERNYSQVEKEGLGVLWAMERLKQYVWGRHVTIFTDHKPLLKLFGHEQEIPSRVANRIIRWSIRLSAFNYNIQFVPTNKMIADYLSRARPGDSPNVLGRPYEESEEHEHIFTMLSNQNAVEFGQVKKKTFSDPVLSTVRRYVRNGWPLYRELPSKVAPFHKYQGEINIDGECLLWRGRIIIPESLRSNYLTTLHENHQGTTSMIRLASQFVWWPGMNKDIERVSGQCDACLSNSPNPPQMRLEPNPWMGEVWTRLHMDFGQIYNKYLLIIVDCSSKFVICRVTNDMKAKTVIDILLDVVCTHGAPLQLFTDNAAHFCNQSMQDFCKEWSIQFITSSPYFARGNGQVERYVKSIKSYLARSPPQKKRLTTGYKPLFVGLPYYSPFYHG